MELVAIVTVLALAQYVWLGIEVGQARGRYSVDAPATTGHPLFERHFRIHQNTLEQLVVFVPAVWLFGWYVSALLAFLLGLAFIAGRFVYARSYLAEPNQRTIGVVITAASNLVLLLGALIGALVRAI